ncbi:ATP-binding cassette domain-containing protein [Microbacterium sp. SSW1-49]|uniref:ATP-binding cassette domain-containing protein n=1 Tax=Microbacterium croceum TaxID=2851645 RepID=A0ABT0FCQ9_9MICO|nr:ATP-binding cassette domain-containing protein [Microbacterium croceum]MCK2035719.1 ATP-binding cassette domain-containing protein [Microbacterium croceum]
MTTAADYLKVNDLVVDFRTKRQRADPRTRPAVGGVDFTIPRGSITGLVGESGSGKSTFGRVLVGLQRPTSGEVEFVDKEHASRAQMVFQDPYSSLNPRQTVLELIGMPLRVVGMKSAKQRRDRVLEMLGFVGLTEEHLDRYPHEFSGGQRQRIGIARALVTSPDFIVADEPVSGLDASVQAQVLGLLRRSRDEFGLTMLFISHDLAVTRYLCEHIAVMQHGHIVEVGTRDEVFNNPQHPYTRALLAAVPGEGPAPADREEAP